MSNASNMLIWAEVSMPYTKARVSLIRARETISELTEKNHHSSRYRLLPRIMESSHAVEYQPCEIRRLRAIGEVEEPFKKHKMPHPPIYLGSLDAVLRIEDSKKTVRTVLSNVRIHEWSIVGTPMSSWNPACTVSENALDQGTMKAIITAHICPKVEIDPTEVLLDDERPQDVEVALNTPLSQTAVRQGWPYVAATALFFTVVKMPCQLQQIAVPVILAALAFILHLNQRPRMVVLTLLSLVCHVVLVDTNKMCNRTPLALVVDQIRTSLSQQPRPVLALQQNAGHAEYGGNSVTAGNTKVGAAKSDSHSYSLNPHIVRSIKTTTDSNR